MKGKPVGARILCTSAVVCLLLDTAAAQTALPSAVLQTGLPSASLQMRLPSASLPQRTRGTPIPPPRRDLFRPGPETFAPRFDEPLDFDPRFFPFFGGPFFGGPFFGGVFVPIKPSWADRGSIRRAPQAEWLGYLRLLVQPEDAEVHIDGFYVGTVADLRRLVTLEAGPHRVELRAAGYETVTFDVRILPNETITYRATLQPSAPVERPAAPAPAAPKTFYVIPNCYAGDKPPDPSALPRTCDLAKLRTVPPVVSGVGPR